MKLSSREKVAKISLVDIAIYCRNNCSVKLSEISKRQNRSVNFLEKIFFLLKKNSMVLSRRPSTGRYTFAKKPDFIKLYDVIKAIDDKLLIDHLNNPKLIDNFNNNKTRLLTFNLLNKFRNFIYNFLNYISIEDVKSDNFLKKMMKI